LTSGDLGSNYTWRLFPALQKIPNAGQHFKKIDQFHTQARAGTLPKFSYIEPSWTIAETTTDAGLKNLFTENGNDYHPPGNMIVAENFVKDVYTSLISNEAAWNKTLLVITFDEFVGSFDHVAPPAAVPPWGGNQPGFPTNGFGFDRYGARVPAILVSPLVPKNTVFRSPTQTPYDHTSVIATTLKWLGQSDKAASFGQRTAHAPTFDNVLSLTQPRKDATDIGFLKVVRKTGDAVQFGDPIFLKNKRGDYITAYQRVTKVSSGLPDGDIMGFAIDLNLAAYFPTLGDGSKVPMTLRTALADPPSQVPDGASLFIVTLEHGVNGANFLGAWADSHDCYYYNTYVQGSYTGNETWVVRQVDHHGQGLKYGDRVYFENVHYKGQRLSRDSRLFQGKWISTTDDNGDWWTIEPAVS
jgi:phospholipase C